MFHSVLCLSGIQESSSWQVTIRIDQVDHGGYWQEVRSLAYLLCMTEAPWHVLRQCAAGLNSAQSAAPAGHFLSSPRLQQHSKVLDCLEYLCPLLVSANTLLFTVLYSRQASVALICCRLAGYVADDVLLEFPYYHEFPPEQRQLDFATDTALSKANQDAQNRHIKLLHARKLVSYH